MALERHAGQGGDGRDSAGTALGELPTVAPPVPGRQGGGLGEGPDSALPDRPEQRARDAALAGADPPVGTGWAYGYDPENALT
ncbi:hypothetical protein [Streptomyces canus]|uniref:hypothetical protein n=1 Tax=Streptomyces canus TaxID=58343 RepID=UPI0007468A01|nr:hypothetical protein [Streptomyces canus]KUN03659.1 hypothetical protein AQI96_37825 [Streptomyces canus]